jgi:hypothetical protein
MPPFLYTRLWRLLLPGAADDLLQLSLLLLNERHQALSQCRI